MDAGIRLQEICYGAVLSLVLAFTYLTSAIQLEVRLLGFRRKRDIPFIRQRDVSECGTTCLAMIFRYHGMYNVQSALRELGHVTRQGTSLYVLSELAEQFGFQADGYRTRFDILKKLPLPFIAHYEGNHFVVVYRVERDHVWIADPASGRERMSAETFRSRWNGVVLTVEPTADIFQNRDVMELVERFRRREKVRKRQLVSDVLQPFKHVLWEIGIASLVLQLLGLAFPFFTQTIVDKVLVDQNRELLVAVLLGLLGVFALQMLLGFVRNLMLTQLRVRFDLDFFGRFFRHLMHLQMSYFDAHRREDFINRFHENLKVRNIFSSTVLQSLIDSLLAVNFLVILFVYNRWLALIAVLMVLLFVLVTVWFTPRLREMEQRVFHENVKTLGGFLDVLMGIETVKLLGAETWKFWEWKNTYKKALNRTLQLEKTHLKLALIMRAVQVLSQISVFCLGALLAFNRELTIGQYIAFVAIFGMVSSSIRNMSGLWLAATRLSVTFDRLGDVLVQEPERFDLIGRDGGPEQPDIEIRDLTFSYSGEGGRPVLVDVNLDIPYGAKIAVVGRNGSGKSTLGRLLTGLYTGYSGCIRVGGHELNRIHPRQLRSRVWMLPQRVHLFNGTIRRNILAASPEATDRELERAIELADLDSYIRSQYMGVHHMVGEGGAGLSGGEQLKIALARLFLGKPSVIILDEASSVLDVEAEGRVLANIRQEFSRETIITIAHRLHTVRSAERILVLDEGRVVEDGTHDQLMAMGQTYAGFMGQYLDF